LGSATTCSGDQPIHHGEFHRAVIQECIAHKRSKIYHPSDFNPHAKKRIQPRTMVGIEALKHVFIDRMQEKQ